ncbi:Eco57I restriction-modification methylase domain-containing protein [Macrococcoides caseolyticum]|uniref:Eco57I restriction-modification methylase domain-containing protein n=1 Tax=Macrococcoides caseolyticum TaxID=69966 RepID=UPI0039C96964
MKLELSFYNDRKIKLSTKSDYYYYIILHLKKLLKKNGRIGLILSNSWLGTDSGKILYKALNEYFEIDTIMISGNGKWFDNANVMSSILILNHKSNLSKSIKFLKLNYPLKELTYEEIDTIANDYILEAKNPYFTQSIYTKDEVSELQNKNISLNSLFFDVSWLNEIEDYIVPLSNNFQVIRGMRRGWDPLFYPPSNHNIEKEYIEPVIKSSRNIKSFNATPDGNAFCCSKTIKELEDLNHIGALSWINKFENGVNKVGIPLTQSLKTGKLHWYEMRTINSLAEIVTSINPGKRIFWSALATPSFINQRLIGLNRNENCETSITLLVALLNSILGLFFIESIGFGRGLGALDIQKNNIEKSYMLNPDLLSDDQKAKIIVSFKNLGNDISEDTRIDLYSSAREDFDKTVLSCYGIVDLYDSIRVSLVNMMNTRIDVRE